MEERLPGRERTSVTQQNNRKCTHTEYLGPSTNWEQGKLEPKLKRYAQVLGKPQHFQACFHWHGFFFWSKQRHLGNKVDAGGGGGGVLIGTMPILMIRGILVFVLGVWNLIFFPQKKIYCLWQGTSKRGEGRSFLSCRGSKAKLHKQVVPQPPWEPTPPPPPPNTQIV